ncbi:hypothetical protein [Burkholderia cepacia]|uniref:hypothetical protein n=1 Tax=Burkholderia cepacia TaxID=292 RepID=UPI00158F549C|nr:hypothetical protein [Burkholderia cepacia]
MVKTLAVCAAFCLAAVAFPRFHEGSVGGSTSAHTLAADSIRIRVHNATIDEPVVVPLSSDGNVERQAAALQGADKPPIVALGAANAGWSDLFNH